jgi:hypothetical protein
VHNEPTASTNEDKTVAAIEQIVLVSAAAASKGEAVTRDAVRRVQDGGEQDLQVHLLEEAE